MTVPATTMPSISVTIPRSGAPDLVFSVSLPIPTSLPLPARPADIPAQADKLSAQLIESWTRDAEAAIAAKLPPARPKGQRVQYDDNDRVSMIVEWDADPPVHVTAHDAAQAVAAKLAPEYRKLYRDGLAAQYERRLKEKVR